MRGILGAMIALLLLASPALAHHQSQNVLQAAPWRASWGTPGARDILMVADSFRGRRNPTHFRGPWCAAFTRMVLTLTGHPSVASNRAIDQIRDGYRVRNPRPGDLAVMRHHVTFFAGWGGRGFYGLGGNQGRHRVTLSSYPVRRVLAWVRPV